MVRNLALAVVLLVVTSGVAAAQRQSCFTYFGMASDASLKSLSDDDLKKAMGYSNPNGVWAEDGLWGASAPYCKSAYQHFRAEYCRRSLGDAEFCKS